MLEEIFEQSKKYLKDNLDSSLDSSTLRLYSSELWQEFLERYGFDKNAQGVYMPKYLSAKVLSDTPFLLPNIFHEYFGHGLFCEKSKLGRKLVELTQKNESLEEFLYDENSAKKQGICGQNIWNYEGFAVWVEGTLCEATHNEEIWEQKQAVYQSQYLELYKHFKDAERLLSREGLIRQMGF